jgi:uncharacterized iron-regulated membrane protein
MRPLWVKVHRWLGLSVALFFGTAALTGAALVYENELDEWINGGIYDTTPGDVGAEVVFARIARDVPGTLVRLRWPLPRIPVYTAEMLALDGSVEMVTLDPGSGDITHRVRRHLPIMSVIRRTHTALLAGRPGHYVVLGASMLGLFSLATGLILWWPGIWRTVRSIRVRMRRGFYSMNFDLHQAMGAVALPLLFLITLTGVLSAYQPAVERVIRTINGEDDGVRGWQDVAIPAAPAGLRAAPGDLLRAARAAVPDGEPLALRMPRREAAAAGVDLLIGPPLSAGATVVQVVLDPARGTVLQVRDPRELELAVRIAGWLNVRLHTGGVGGPFARLAYTVVCLLGTGLVITGVLIWWLKRSRTDAANRRTFIEPAASRDRALPVKS